MGKDDSDKKSGSSDNAPVKGERKKLSFGRSVNLKDLADARSTSGTGASVRTAKKLPPEPGRIPDATSVPENEIIRPKTKRKH